MRNRKGALWVAVAALSLLQATVPATTQASSCADPREQVQLEVVSVTVDDVEQDDLSRWDQSTWLVAEEDGVSLVVDDVSMSFEVAP